MKIILLLLIFLTVNTGCSTFFTLLLDENCQKRKDKNQSVKCDDGGELIESIVSDVSVGIAAVDKAYQKRKRDLKIKEDAENFIRAGCSPGKEKICSLNLGCSCVDSKSDNQRKQAATSSN